MHRHVICQGQVRPGLTLRGQYALMFADRGGRAVLLACAPRPTPERQPDVRLSNKVQR